MATNYTIRPALAGQLNVSGAIDKTVLPLLHQAVRAVAAKTAENWQVAVLKAKLWSGERDAYAQSITWEMTGDFSAEVRADYRLAAEIETGRPQRDLKRMLDTSGKVRRTTDGRRFLIIPMRHNTPGNEAHAAPMPSTVHDLAKQMAPSRVTAVGRRASGEVTMLSPTTGMHPSPHQTPYLTSLATRKAAKVARMKYAWGDRLTAAMLRGAGADKATVKRYSGMVRMEASTSSSRSSGYMTFRVMMEGQKGWVIPAKPGLYIAKGVADDMAGKAEKAFSAAIKATVIG